MDVEDFFVRAHEDFDDSVMANTVSRSVGMMKSNRMKRMLLNLFGRRGRRIV